MNIWTQPPLNIGYYCSLTHEFPFTGIDKCIVKGGHSLKHYLKHNYRPIFNGNSVYFAPQMTAIEQLFFYCKQAVGRVELLVLEQEKNQSDQTRAFWKNKLLCPISGGIFKTPVRDNHGHIFEKAAIDAHVTTSHSCPVNGEQILKLAVDNNYSAYVKGMITKFLPPQPRSGIAIHDEVAQQHLVSLDTYIKIEKYNQALSLYDVLCDHSNRSSTYAMLPHILLQLNDPLKAALAYLYLAMRQLEEQIDASANIEKAFELLPNEVTVHALRAFYFFFQNNQSLSKKAFCTLVELFIHDTDTIFPLIEPALTHLHNNLQIYHEITDRVSEAVRMRLFLIGIADFHKRDANISRMFYDKAHTLKPNSNLPHLARLCRLEIGDAERVVLYERLAKNFREQGNDAEATCCIELRDQEKQFIQICTLPPMPHQMNSIIKERSTTDEEFELISQYPGNTPPTTEKIVDFGFSLIEKTRNFINELPVEHIEAFTEIKIFIETFSNLHININTK